jgi:hypothetical protein
MTQALYAHMNNKTIKKKILFHTTKKKKKKIAPSFPSLSSGMPESYSN